MNSKEQEIEKRSILDPLIDKVFGSSRSSKNKNKSVSKRTEALAGRISSDLTAMVKMTSKIQTSVQKNESGILAKLDVGADASKASTILDNMLSFMQKSREQDTQEFDTKSSFNEMNEKASMDKHREIMDVFIEATKKKRQAESNMAKEAKKRKTESKKEEKKDVTPKKGEAPPKVETKPAAPAPKPAAPQAPAPKPAAPAPKPAAPQAPAPKPAAPQAPAPKPAAPAKPAPTAKPVEAPAAPSAPSAVVQTIKRGAKTAARAGAIVGIATASSVGAFAKEMFPYAKMASEKLGGKIPPEAILAQWAGESSNGKSVPAPFNFAGIKAGPNDKKGDYVLTEERYTPEQIKRAEQRGESVQKVLGPNDTISKKGKQVTIDEWFGKGSIEKAKSEGKQWVQVRSYFAKYDSPEEFANAYVKFLSSNRYKKARESTSASGFGLEVAKAGYATASAEKYSQHIGNYVGQNAELLSSLSTENTDIKKNLAQQSSDSTLVVSQNTTNNQQKTVVMNPARKEELNPTMRS